MTHPDDPVPHRNPLVRLGVRIRRFYRVWLQPDNEDRNPRVSDLITRDGDDWP